MRVPANAKYVLVYSVSEHRYLGWIIEPYIIQVTSGGILALVNQRIHSGTADYYDKKLDSTDYRAIEILDRIRPEQITKKFSPVQKIRPKEFFTKHLTKEQLDNEIRPYVQEQLAEALELLKGKLIYTEEKDNPAGRRIEWTKEPSSVLFHLRKNDDNTHYFATIKHGDERLNYYRKSIILTDRPCFMIADGKMLYFRPDFDGRKLKTFLSKKFIVIPTETEDTYFRKFIAPLIEENSMYAKGHEIVTETHKAIPRVHLIEFNDDFALGLRFRYEQHIFPYQEDKKVSVMVRKTGDHYTFVRVRRSLNWEAQRYEDLIQMGLTPNHYPSGTLIFDPPPGVDAITWLQEHADKLREEGFELGRETSKNFNLAKATIEVEVTEENDWFDVQTIVKFGEFSIPFKELVPYIRSGEREFKLPNGEIALIPEEWITELSALLELSSNRTNIRLKKHHIGLLAGMDDRLKPANINQYLEEFEGIEEIDLPSGFKGDLREYQKAGFDWFYFLKSAGFGGVLADDMGLGKTVQTLALLAKEKELSSQSDFKGSRPVQMDIFSNAPSAVATSLLIVPTSLIHNWVKEAKKFTPDLKVLIHRGQTRSTDISHFVNYDVVISTYGTVRNDEELLRDFTFHYIILDESQYIKNPNSKAAQSINRLRSNHRLTLTGTPIENTVNDLWSQMNFLNKGLLGSYRYFQRQFVTPIEKKKDPKAVARLQEMIRPFVLRRTKKQVATDLPDKFEQIVYCEMTDEQREIYEEVKSVYRNSILEAIDAQGLEKSKLQLIKGLIELRQIANYPGFVKDDYEGESGKTEEAFRMIETAVDEDHKILIFSQFVRYLHVFRERLDAQGIEYCYLDGSTSSKEREKEVEKFQNDPTIRVFLISLKAGGVGLNLTEADYVFLLDPWWNPAAENQAIDRTHRIGQKQNVFSYKFITLDTVEEKILKLQEHKQHLSDSLITIEESFVKKLTGEDIAQIFQ